MPGVDIDNAGTFCLIGDLFGGTGALPTRFFYRILKYWIKDGPGSF